MTDDFDDEWQALLRGEFDEVEYDLDDFETHDGEDD